MRLSGYGGEAPRGPDAATFFGNQKRGIGEVLIWTQKIS